MKLHTTVTQYLSHDNIGMSRNDCLNGLLWTLKCIVADAPLPGQVHLFVISSTIDMHLC